MLMSFEERVFNNLPSLPWRFCLSRPVLCWTRSVLVISACVELTEQFTEIGLLTPGLSLM